jgi:hypothetical protein
MPIFGRSLFETVLEGLDEPAEEDAEETAAVGIRGFHAGFVGRAWSASPDMDVDPSLRFDDFPADPVITASMEPDWIERLSEAEIAEDLGLAQCRRESELREKRRLFAMRNHPDRVPDQFRPQATRRMMIANQMIDAALARLA